MQKSDIAACIYNTEIFDFLMDIIPKEEVKQALPLKKVNTQLIQPVPSEGYFGGLNTQFLKEFQ